MRAFEYGVVFDSYAGQIGDFKKAPPVDFIGCVAPPGQAIVLLFE
jgi:hypothetical protein